MAYIRTTKQFIAMLKQARIDQGLTQAELGKKTGMSQKKVAMIENLTASPRLDVLLIIANTLGIEISMESPTKSEKKIKMVWE